MQVITVPLKNLGSVSDQKFGHFSRKNGPYSNVYEATGNHICKEFDQALWFDIRKYMWNNYCSVFDYLIRYVNNDITKSFNIIILKYSGCLCESFYHEIFLSNTIKKGEEFDK